MSNGRSGMRITSAPPASPECSAIQPAWRPITSTTRLRWWLSAVVWRRSMASVATWRAVSKPNVMSVPPRSLSIVFGTPTIGSPSAPRRAAAPSVSSPPITISPSTSSSARFERIRSAPSSRASGLVREEPRIVPPRGRMPRTDSIVSSSDTFSIGPRQPSRKPRIECPCWSMPLRTTARITAFRPGQSPPPVRTPMRISRPTYPRRGRSRLPAWWVLVAVAAVLGGCGSSGPTGVPKGVALTVYSSLPRAGVSARTAEAVAAGERLALADAHGRAAGRSIRLVELDSAVPGSGQAWDPAAVEANARRAVDDRTAIAYIGEPDLGASAASVPVTSGDQLLQVSPGDGLTTLTRADPAEPEELPERYYHGGRRNFVRLVPSDAQQAAAMVAWARAGGAHRLAIVRDDELFGRELAAEAAAAALREHMPVTAMAEARHGAADYLGLSRDVAARAPDAVIYTGLGDPDAARLLATLGRALPGAALYGSSALAQSPDAGGPPAQVLKPAGPASAYGKRGRAVLRRLRLQS